jgi:hypothetical protein
VVVMDYSTPHCLLINMPQLTFCSICGQVIFGRWPKPKEGEDSHVGYKGVKRHQF